MLATNIVCNFFSAPYESPYWLDFYSVDLVLTKWKICSIVNFIPQHPFNIQGDCAVNNCFCPSYVQTNNTLLEHSLLLSKCKFLYLCKICRYGLQYCWICGSSDLIVLPRRFSRAVKFHSMRVLVDSLKGLIIASRNNRSCWKWQQDIFFSKRYAISGWVNVQA